MYGTYFDEVKADPRQGQDSYWLGGNLLTHGGHHWKIPFLWPSARV